MKLKAKKGDKIYLYWYNDYTCYKCNKDSEIVQAFIQKHDLKVEGSYYLLELEYLKNKKIGEKIQKEVPLYYKDYSKTAEEKYYMNHCQYCGAKFGDWFVYFERKIEHAYDPVKPIREKIIEI